MPDNRPAFHVIFMNFATELARRSTCRRLQVGCVIASEDYRRVYAVGYNGNASGDANDCDRHGEAAVGNCGCLHAEENAVINCTVERFFRKVVFCTHLPCVMCAKRLINLGGVLRIYYGEAYRSTDSIPILEKAGIPVLRVVPP